MSKPSSFPHWLPRLCLLLAGALWLWFEWQSASTASCRSVVLRVTAPEAPETARLGRSEAGPISEGVFHRAGRELFTRDPSPPGLGLAGLARPPAATFEFVRIESSMVGGKRSPFWQPPGRGRVNFPLPGAETVVVTIDDSEMTGPERFLSTGRVDGWPGSRAWFAWNRGYMHVVIDDPLRGSFVLEPVGVDRSRLYRVDPGLVAPCGGGRPPDRMAVPARAGAREVGDWLGPAVAAAVDNPQRAEVHVLMLYTPSVLSALSQAERAAAVQTVFDVAIARVNAVFEASLISARVRLVGVAETRYNESVSAGNRVQDDALTALYLDRDGQMDEIHALRDQVGADVVCLALGRSDVASSGLSFLLDDRDRWDNAQYAFSIVHYGSVAGTTVVAHELGHLFGCAHDRENARSAGGAFGYSYGYRFVGADGRQYRDIMAYPPGTELPYFSNPEVLAPAPASVPLGIAAGRPGESNTALTIERTAFATAAYRLQTQAPAGRGTMINVATRAHVGTGEDVLIGGFVVRGSEPKTLLVRAAGPALAAFGVEGALGDPVLRVFDGGRQVAENDQWGVTAGQGNPVESALLAQAVAQVRAFPFPLGSADAALLATLPAGAYSAVVEGAQGTTGSALVEVYEVGGGSARIVNLATRGYAGRDGREMVGGFVIAGEAGSTKRVLIRVLGPTLGRAPFLLTGVLDDPEMELRNAAGELLLTGDDWTSEAEGGVGPENDFRPVVVSYGEKQIFATGLAPKNRREPCLLVDLPPGSYTAIVRPFESRSAKPADDQPAVPGVGVIEVYEIGP